MDPMIHVSQIAAMAALARHGAFEELLRGRSTAAELAARLSLDEGALGRALEVARALGFLSKRDGAYEPSEAASMGGAMMLRLARDLPEHMRSGASLTRDIAGRERLYAWVTPILAQMFHARAQQLADALADAPCSSILDVGAGSGVWSLAMAARHPEAVVSALDLAPVLERFCEGAGDRPHELIVGDYHEVTLDPRFDRVLLANVLHLEVEAKARSLLAKASAWRKPGGRVIVIDAMFRTEASDLALASYELHLALRVEGGRVYEASTLESWAHELGLEVESSIVLDPGAGVGALVLR